MTKYGITYWGKKWLEALNGIDYSSRLPRGRSYATRGLAYDISISANQVTAKVQGSRRQPYVVKLSLLSLSKKEKETVKSTILGSPSVLSQFLSRHLSESLYNTLEKKNITLFPANWKDMSAKCSCPDWAVPCKHIAAVIYLIANEIDKNPFIVFTLNDCDLLELIDGVNESAMDQAQQIPSIETLLTTNKRNTSTFDQDKLDLIDLSQIPDLANHICTILPANPPFYEKDFKEILKKAYTYWGRRYTPAAHQNITKSLTSNPEHWQSVTLVFDDNYFLKNVVHPEGNCFIHNEDFELSLLQLLSQLSPAELHLLCPELRFLHTLYQFALNLFKRRALIPQVLQTKKNITFIRWVPALFDPTVKDIFQQLVSICPPSLVMFNKKKVSPEEQVKSSLALSFAMLVANELPKSVDTHLDTEIGSMFFLSGGALFNEFSTKEIPQTINLWLSRLHLSEKSHKICIKILDKKDGFHVDVHVMTEASKLPKPLQKALATKDTTLRLSILSDLAILGDYIPGLNESIDTEASLILELKDFSTFFFQVLPVLKALGITTILPRSLRKILRPNLRLDLATEEGASNKTESFLQIDKLLTFNWKIAIGDKQLTAAEFKKLLQNSRGLVKIMDQYVLLDEKEIEKLLKAQEKAPALHQADVIQAALAGEYNGAEVHLDENLKKLVSKMTTFKPAIIPDNLNATLRPYQERGFSWLIQNIQTGFGSIIADDMGLGKTLQVIATILHCKNTGLLTKKKVLVIAPTSLLTNWQREIKRFAPELTTCLYHGQNRKFLKEFDIAITSYGLARRDTTTLNKMDWFLLALDEAQNIKNPTTGQTKAIKSIKAEHKIAMSGTPVENRLLEYWSIFDFTNKQYLGTPKQFKERFADPIEKERDKQCLEQFSKITAPFMLRRLKSDKTVIRDLPAKIEKNRYCSLTPEQTALYKEVVDLTMQQIEKSEGIERKGLVFKLLNALKQIGNHPAHYSKTGDAHIEQSGKLQALVELLTDVHETGEKALIFTQYVEMGTILSQVLQKKFSFPVPFLHGGLSRKKRDQLVHEFQNSSQIRTLIVSLKAGGTGLNLTAANHVIHYDLWWNPAVEAQATDRAYRIGQKKNVMVHRLLSTGTFEEQIDEMIQKKKELANLAVSTGESWISEFDNDQLKDLVTIRQLDQ